MKHGFTDDQIVDAKHAAAKNLSRDWISGFDVTDIRAILDALPEPEIDEWQECGFKELHATDKRVKAVFIGGSIIEGTPDRRNEEHVFLVDGPVIHSYDDATFYRIPKPVTPPDPAENPVIIIYRPNGNGKTPVTYAWTGQHYRSFDGNEYFSAQEITDWTPAKVVADEPVRPEDVGF